jgi:hypothetical protein
MSKTFLMALVFTAATLSLQSCSSEIKPESPSAKPSTAETTEALKTPEGEFMEVDGYRFKLSPDVQDDGVAHLDFYVRDKAGKHLKGVTGTFTVTKPDGTKVDIPIVEETPHDHYHGMIKLDQPGEYLIVTQVTIDGKRLNPRFSFTRKMK